MDAQALELAQRAVTALETMAAPQPNWTEVLGSVGGLAIGLIQYGLIYVGLRRMGQASEERKTQHAETMAALQQQGEERKTQHAEAAQTMQTQHAETMAALQQQGAALADIGAGIRELIRERSG